MSKGCQVRTVLVIEDEANPVVVITASAGVSRRDKALAIGAADYLVKPVSAASLREAVARALFLKRRRWHAIKKSVCTGC